MSSDRSKLHDLVDELPREQVPFVLDELRRRTERPRAVHVHPFAWVGAGPANNGRDDNALRVDDLLAEGFGR